MDASDEQIAAVAALDEPTRRRIYDYVVRQPAPVSRDQAAEALGLPRTTAAFHLERLARQGLFDVVHERLGGRTGPGAGRPAKLYRRSSCDVAVSLPERHYDLAGQLLAAALEDSERSGDSPRAVLDQHAFELGRSLARAAHADDASPDPRTALRQVLERHGYEPRTEGAGITLANCPFHLLARQHTELVCGMNLRVLDGVLDGLPGTALSARLQPRAGSCCVQLTPAVGDLDSG